MASTGHSRRDVVQSLERGLLILRAFSHERRPLTMSEIAEMVDLSRPSVRRMLLTLESLGYTVQQGSTWTLTPRVLEIGSGYFTDTSLAEIAQPFLHEIADAFGETCNVGMYDRGQVVQLARAEVQRVVPDGIRIGTRLPAHATALGTVVLGGLDDELLDDYFAHAQLDAYTPQTLVDEKRLRARITAAHAVGYAATSEELEAGMIAIAVPIMIDRTIIAALGTTSTTARQSIESMVESKIPVLQTTAAEIARMYQLGNPHRPLPQPGR